MAPSDAPIDDQADQLPALIEPIRPGALRPLPDGNLIPSLIADAGDQAAWRYVDFFTSNIRNPNTRRARRRIWWMIPRSTIICFVMLVRLSSASLAQDLEAQAAALKVIRETAAELCYTIEQKGLQRDTELDADANAKLNGAISKVLGLGVGGSGKLSEKEYQGVLRDELVSAIKSSTDCRRDVFNKLVEKMLPSTKSKDREQSNLPDHITLTPWSSPTSQNGLQAIRAQPHNLDEQGGKLIFSGFGGSDWPFLPQRWDQCGYSLMVDGLISFKTESFNQASYLRGLSDISVTGRTFTEQDPRCSGLGSRNLTAELLPDALHFRLYLKFKSKPQASDEILLRTGPHSWSIQIGNLDWTEIHGLSLTEPETWWGAGAKLLLSDDNPNWVVLHSARIVPVLKNGPLDREALLEVVVENRTDAPVPVDSLRLTAVEPDQVGCAIGPNYQEPPTVQVAIDWPKLVRLSKSGEPNGQVSVTMADSIVAATATYSPGSCMRSSTFRTEIPIQATIPPSQLARITLDIKELSVKSGRNLPVLSWNEITVAVSPNGYTFPHQYAISGTLPIHEPQSILLQTR